MQDTTAPETTRYDSSTEDTETANDIIRFTWFTRHEWAQGLSGVLLSSLREITLDEVYTFIRAFEIPVEGILGMLIHPDTLPATFNRAARDEWRFLLSYYHSPDHLTDYIDDRVYYIGDETGALRRIDYADIRKTCPLIAEIFSADDKVCGKCAMNGPICRKRVELPELRRIVGDKAAQRFLTASNFHPGMTEQFTSNTVPHGFQRVTPHEARPQARQTVPTGRPYRADQINLHPDDLARNRAAQKEAVQKSATTRRVHNEVCGTGADTCMFRDHGCTRWRGWGEQCTRRWSSAEELAEDIYANFTRLFEDRYENDMKLQNAVPLSFQIVHPRTRRYRTVYYRGMIRRKHPNPSTGFIETFFTHELYSISGNRTSQDFLIRSYEDLVRFLRRWAPHIYEQFILDPKELEEPSLMEKVMMIALSAKRQIRNHTILNVSYSPFGARVRTANNSWHFSDIEDFVSNWSWPVYATQ